jgi:hypothetical protein
MNNVRVSTSEVDLVKYPYDEQQPGLILAFLVCSLVSESAALDTTSRGWTANKACLKEPTKISVQY